MELKKKQLIWFVLIALLALSFLFINNRNSAYFKNSDQSDLHIQNKISTTKNVIKAEPITLPLLENRNDFGKMMESLKGEEMIEIGVQEGLFADQILNSWPSLKKYNGIDVWRLQNNYVDHANKGDNEQEIKYQKTVKTLAKYGDKIKLFRSFSSKAAVNFKEKSIDFIYVDARHDFCGVYEDLKIYYPKLKCNGVMAGHDYHTADEVMQASNQDFGLCANGSRILLNGGAVKGARTYSNKFKHLIKEFFLFSI